MADATYNEVVALVPDRYEYRMKKGEIAYFPGTGLFGDGILENPKSKGGGANVRLVIKVNAPKSDGSSDDYISINNEHGATSIPLISEYYQVKSEFTVAKTEVDKIDANADAQLSFVDGLEDGAAEQAMTDIETQFWSNTDMTALGGPKAWLSGASYCGITRADTTQWGNDAAVSLTTVLGTGVAYDYTTYAVTKPTRYQTYWNCAVDYAAAPDQGEFLCKVIHQLYFRIKRRGPKNKPTHLCVGSQVESLLAWYASNNQSNALQWGLQKSLTAIGDTSDLTFLGMKVYGSELISDDDVFLINKNYTYVPALRNHSPTEWSRSQQPSPSYVQATLFTALTSFKFMTDAPIAHGWIELA
jgi:hypothetical protein